ncbi:MAG: DMT family transporter [Cyanobacteria bacterium J06639_1]
MNGRAFFMLAALTGGAFVPVQIALNTLLRRYVSESMQVTLISYSVGTLTSLVLCWVARYPLPAASALSQTTWWMWMGGMLGTMYVWSTIAATPQIGAVLALALAIAGQMIAALVLDHYGALGLPKYAASPMRIAGAVLVVLGVAAIASAKR